ncbi:MAG: hypothetical protein EAZ44_06425 [Cytophagia bacterium]|nr:MAG: hypothetical protein EAY69_09990 [Cytophagales bacterium]TAG03061.1 MAG: hypothetical protein EAZ44_06425 [Cytophagia bacterium]TAG42259.1 MAG: hypothetical protein EAZ31_06370 [Cytophagia bacterium]
MIYLLISILSTLAGVYTIFMPLKNKNLNYFLPLLFFVIVLIFSILLFQKTKDNKKVNGIYLFINSFLMNTLGFAFFTSTTMKIFGLILVGLTTLTYIFAIILIAQAIFSQKQKIF